MSKINVSTITNRTGTSGPVLSGVTTATNGFHVTGGSVGIRTDAPAGTFQLGNNNSSNVIISENLGIDINDGAINLYQATDNVNAVPFLISSDVGAGTENEKLRVSAAGNVGIGTNVLASSSRLTIFEESGNGQTIEIKAKNNGGAGSQPGIKFTADNGDNIGGVYGDVNSDALKIQTGGTDRLTITNAGIAEFVAPGRIATFTGNGIEINNSLGSNIFIGTQSGAEGKMGTVNNAAMALFTNNDYAKRVELQTTGDFAIMDGNLAVANGHGINFSATTPDGTVPTSELLDDYEEGTWTPALSNFTLGNGIITGQYTKMGNIVHVTFRIDAGSTTTFTGNANGISGLPFSNALGSNSGYLTASNPSNNWFGWTQQYSTGTATNYIQWITSSGIHQVGSATVPFTWGSSTIMRFNMTYRAA